MIASSQGSPFLLNFDERSMAGMMLQARQLGRPAPDQRRQRLRLRPGRLPGEHHGRQRPLRHGGRQPEPAQGGRAGPDRRLRPAALHRSDDRQDRKAPALGRGHRRRGPLHDLGGVLGGLRRTRRVPSSGASSTCTRQSESIRAQLPPTPYLSCLVRGCAEKGMDITQGGAELGYVTIEAVTYATTVDSLLAVKYLVFDEKVCTHGRAGPGAARTTGSGTRSCRPGR